MKLKQWQKWCGTEIFQKRFYQLNFEGCLLLLCDPFFIPWGLKNIMVQISACLRCILQSCSFRYGDTELKLRQRRLLGFFEQRCLVMFWIIGMLCLCCRLSGFWFFGDCLLLFEGTNVRERSQGRKQWKRKAIVSAKLYLRSDWLSSSQTSLVDLSSSLCWRKKKGIF